MKKNIYIFFSILFFAVSFILSCKKNNTSNKEQLGENIVPQDKLELIIYDIHITDAIVASKMMKNSTPETDSILYESIFRKHNCSRQDFENTLLFYINNKFDSLISIYDRVINRINTEKAYIYK